MVIYGLFCGIIGTQDQKKIFKLDTDVFYKIYLFPYEYMDDYSQDLPTSSIINVNPFNILIFFIAANFPPKVQVPYTFFTIQYIGTLSNIMMNLVIYF